jgi:hypothetical protein
MPPKRKNNIGKRERRALGIPSPVVPVAAAAAAAEPLNRSESMVMVTPEEQQQQQQQQQQQSFNFPEPQEPSGYSLSPIAAADESMNQTDSDSVAQVEPNFIMTDSSDSSMGSSPTPLMRKMLGMKKKSPRRSSPRRNSPPRRKSSPRRNSPRAQTFRRRKLSIDKPEYLKASPSVVQIRNKLMGLAQVASRTRRNSVKINEYTEKIRMTLDELNPYFLFIQQYIAGRGEIQRELDAVVEDRTKLMGERERLVGDLADKSQMNANSKIQEVAEGQIGILNDQIGELNKRIEELGAQLESATRANQMYENILRDIPADIDKMRGFIDAEDATLSENITALDQVLSNFSNQLKERLQNTLPQDQHAAFNASRGGGCRKCRQSRKYRKSRSYRRMTRKYRKHRKMTRKYRK